MVFPGPADRRAATLLPAAGNGPAPAPGPPPIAAAAVSTPEPGRPVFIDPPAPSRPEEVAGPDWRPQPASSESVYEQTILPSAGTLSGLTRRGFDADRPQLPASPLMIAGLVAAVAVVVAAILLIVGVL